MKVDDFSVRIDEGQLDDLRKAVAAARLPPDFYEGTQPDLGVTSQWMKEAKRQWETTYDWSVSTFSCAMKRADSVSAAGASLNASSTRSSTSRPTSRTTTAPTASTSSTPAQVRRMRSL